MHVLHSHVSLSWHAAFATPVPGPHLNHHLLHGSLTYRLEPALGVYIIGCFFCLISYCTYKCRELTNPFYCEPIPFEIKSVQYNSVQFSTEFNQQEGGRYTFTAFNLSKQEAGWERCRGEMCKQSELSIEPAEFKWLHINFFLCIELCGAISTQPAISRWLCLS